MEIYLDVLIIINFISDFLILLSVSIILRRNVKLKKIILACIIGTISLIVLFINLNSAQIFLLKIILGIIMNMVAFNYKSFKYLLNNLLYFFINSVLLGGFIYLINLKFKNIIVNELFFNMSIFVIFLPFIIYIYIKACLKLKNDYSLTYKVDIYIKSRIVSLIAYYDTGNNLVDPYKKRAIILVNQNHFKDIDLNYILVPCHSVNDSFLMRCFKPDAVYIKGIGTKNNLLIGVATEKIKINGVDCLLNKKVLEGD